MILIDPRATQDIQEAINYYDNQQIGLGKRFEKELNKYMVALEKNPYYRIRYNKVRCLPMKKFPYMLHFSIEEEKNWSPFMPDFILRLIFEIGKLAGKAWAVIDYMPHKFCP